MFRIVTIPFDPAIKGFDDEVLRQFVLNKAVLHYQAAFFQEAGTGYWSVFIEYDALVEKGADKELEGLDEPQRILLERLKAWRKERAQKEGVPVYIVGTNREMGAIARKAPGSLEALKSIKGFGKGKIAKYGQEIVGIVSAFYSKV